MLISHRLERIVIFMNWADVPLQSPDVVAFYDALAPHWDGMLARPRINQFRDFEAQLILRALKLQQGDSVLNLGIGTGDFEKRTSAPTQYGVAQWYGIDLSEAMLTVAQYHHPEITLFKTDCTKLPPGISFNKCLCQHVLCHVQDISSVVKGVFDRLPEGGIFTFIEYVRKSPNFNFPALNPLESPQISEPHLRNDIKSLEWHRPPSEYIDPVEDAGFRTIFACRASLDTVHVIAEK